MPPTQVELALGKIKIVLEDPINNPGGEIVYFGIINSMQIKDSEQLKAFYAPDDSSPTLRKRFGTLYLAGAGQIILGGTLASLRDDSGTFCSGFNDLAKAAIERKVWEKINIHLDFDFDDSTDNIYTLYDGKVGPVNMGIQGYLMSGKLTLQYSWAEPAP